MSRPLGAFINEGLLAELRKRFPNRVPALDASERTVWAAVGDQNIIDFLQREFDETHTPAGAGDDEF